MADDGEAGLGCLGCCAQVPAFLGAITALLWWFMILWAWLGLFWAIAGSIFFGFIPLAIAYYAQMFAFGSLIAFGVSRWGRTRNGQFLVGGMGVVLSLLTSAVLVLSIIWLFDSLTWQSTR